MFRVVSINITQQTYKKCDIFFLLMKWNVCIRVKIKRKKIARYIDDIDMIDESSDNWKYLKYFKLTTTSFIKFDNLIKAFFLFSVWIMVTCGGRWAQKKDEKKMKETDNFSLLIILNSKSKKYHVSGECVWFGLCPTSARPSNHQKSTIESNLYITLACLC